MKSRDVAYVGLMRNGTSFPEVDSNPDWRRGKHTDSTIRAFHFHLQTRNLMCLLNQPALLGDIYRLSHVPQRSGGCALVYRVAMQGGVAPPFTMPIGPRGRRAASLGLCLTPRASPAHEPITGGCQFHAKSRPLVGMSVRVHLLLLDGYRSPACGTRSTAIRRGSKGRRRGGIGRVSSRDEGIPCQLHRVRIGVVLTGGRIVVQWGTWSWRAGTVE